MGGRLKLPAKMRIEEAAARKQALIDSGKEPIVGVNLFRPDTAEPMEILEVDTPPCAKPK